ncbi:hypothetical protein BURPSS13_X0904 [Burkholderia pseudomallei S13]|nr:hypothetical protein BURPSS13_X0904 [Burkholderia pseudomallei S13]
MRGTIRRARGATANVQWHASAMHSSTETDGGRRVAPHRECDA